MSEKLSVKSNANQTDIAAGNVPSRTEDESNAADDAIAQVAREIANAGSAGPHELDDADAIPMLTDVLPASAANAPDKAPEDETEPVNVGPPENMSEEDWNRMALRVQKSVMKNMLRRTDELVDGNLRDQLDEFLDRSAERLMADLKSTMEQAVRDAVSRAIAEELSAVRKRIKRS